MREGKGSSPASQDEAENSQRPWWTDRGLAVLVICLIRTWLFKTILNSQVEQVSKRSALNSIGTRRQVAQSSRVYDWTWGNPRILVECLGMEGNLRITKLQPLCLRLGFQPPHFMRD